MILFVSFNMWVYLLHIVGSLQSLLFGTVTMNDVNHHLKCKKGEQI